jgi:hypothetical protein
VAVVSRQGNALGICQLISNSLKRKRRKPVEQSDLVGLSYKLKHTRSKKAVINSYPELKGKTIKEVEGLIAVNTMITTGKSLKEQKETRQRRQYFLLKRLYWKNK